MCTNNSLGVAAALGSELDISLPLSALNKPTNSLGYGCNTHMVWCNHLLLPVPYLRNQNSATWAHAVSSAPPHEDTQVTGRSINSKRDPAQDISQ